jgi:hypothetical protein
MMSRVRKWTATAIFVMAAGLFTAEAASPELAMSESPASGHVCGGVHTQSSRWGSCDAGGNCCFGYPEAPCNILGN